MATIIRNSKDRWHEEIYMCSNCHRDLFAASVITTEKPKDGVNICKLQIHLFDGKSIPTICPKCMEILEFPSDIDIPIKFKY